MNSITINHLKDAMEVFQVWGLWLFVYGVITVSIIAGIFKVYSIFNPKKVLHLLKTLDLN